MVSRKGAKGAKRYVLLFLCQKYCTQITQNHADALRNFAPLREEFHTELKVAVRTCEGKAIHGIHRKVSTYLQVSARMFFSH